jgi:hypothetical protein
MRYFISGVLYTSFSSFSMTHVHKHYSPVIAVKTIMWYMQENLAPQVVVSGACVFFMCLSPFLSVCVCICVVVGLLLELLLQRLLTVFFGCVAVCVLALFHKVFN